MQHDICHYLWWFVKELLTHYFHKRQTNEIYVNISVVVSCNHFTKNLWHYRYIINFILFLFLHVLGSNFQVDLSKVCVNYQSLGGENIGLYFDHFCYTIMWIKRILLSSYIRFKDNTRQWEENKSVTILDLEEAC